MTEPVAPAGSDVAVRMTESAEEYDWVRGAASAEMVEEEPEEEGVVSTKLDVPDDVA